MSNDQLFRFAMLMYRATLICPATIVIFINHEDRRKQNLAGGMMVIKTVGRLQLIGMSEHLTFGNSLSVTTRPVQSWSGISAN